MPTLEHIPLLASLTETERRDFEAKCRWRDYEAGRSIIEQDPIEYQRLRETPWVSALLGPCYGSSTWYSAMSDFVVMRKGAIMAIASPWLALVPLVFALLALVLGVSIRRQIMWQAREGAAMSNMKTGLLVEAVEGIETIKAG